VRRKSEKDKKLADDARLLRAWRKRHGEQLEKALAGECQPPSLQWRMFA